MLGMTLDDFLARVEREQDELVAPLIGWVWKPFGEPSFDGGGCYWKTGGGPRRASIINGGWPAFGAMWDALPRDGYTWQFGECAGGHYVTGHDRNHAPYYHVKAKSLNLAVAAALWQASQKEGV